MNYLGSLTYYLTNTFDSFIIANLQLLFRKFWFNLTHVNHISNEKIYLMYFYLLNFMFLH